MKESYVQIKIGKVDKVKKFDSVEARNKTVVFAGSLVLVCIFRFQWKIVQ